MIDFTGATRPAREKVEALAQHKVGDNVSFTTKTAGKPTTLAGIVASVDRDGMGLCVEVTEGNLSGVNFYIDVDQLVQ